MGSMYDKLGDLLSGALESGTLPPKNNNPQFVSPEEGDTKKSSVLSSSRKRAARIIFGKKKIRKGEIIRTYHTAVSLPDYVARSYAVLETGTDSTEDEIRNAYRAKLKIFHPDINSSNETIQKIAKRKTAEIIEAYEILTEWKSRQKNGQDK
ncbi:MAG: J domain-containing protein [Treponema sp.]|nr:J domain-containing protein [Treponema sp.]